MGINPERDIEAHLQIGPPDQGMVRLFIDAGKIEIPMDFDPEEAREIAEEIIAAAQAAEGMGRKKR
jgi:ArsR family metal-binding transcriptional regulator